MTNYKVFLPCAGIGARLGEFTDNVNKALLSVGNKPVISHIVEKFDNIDFSLKDIIKVVDKYKIIH